MKITIARQCGSGGHKVADILSEKLGMEIFDKKRFIEESKRRNVYDENANFLNEKPIDSFLYSLIMSYGSKNRRGDKRTHSPGHPCRLCLRICR